MNSFILVLLALIAGAAAGGGVVVAMRRAEVHPPVLATADSPSQPAGEPEIIGPVDVNHQANPGSSKEYLRLAQALLLIDERITAMEDSQEAAMAGQRKLVDEIREMAMQLEIRSGQMKPMRPASQPLQQMRTLPDAQPISPGIRPVPAAAPTRPAPRPLDAAGDPLPEW